jgi:hypothetical protein
MEADYQDSASYRWLNKKVLDSRLLDDMHSLDQWTAITNGPVGLVDARLPYQVPRANYLPLKSHLRGRTRVMGTSRCACARPRG